MSDMTVYTLAGAGMAKLELDMLHKPNSPRLGYADGPPVEGYWQVGDIIFNNGDNSNVKTWTCVEEGAPGVWVAGSGIESFLTDVTSSDSDVIEVTTPAGDTMTRELLIKSNRPYGLAKLDANGKLPLSQLPLSGISIVGPYRGDDLCPKGSYDTTCVAPDYRNPSQRFPTTIFSTGESFIVIMAAGQLSGHINLIDLADNTEKPIEVFAGDGIIFIDPAVLPPPPPVSVKGWYLLKDMLKGNSVLASQVVYDNTLSKWVGTNVQSVLDEISGRAALLDEENLFLGIARFDNNVYINTGRSLRLTESNPAQSMIALRRLSDGNIGIGDVATVDKLRFDTKPTGTLHHYVAVGQEYEIWDARNLSHPAQTNIENNFGGLQHFLLGIVIGHNESVRLVDSVGNYRPAFSMDVGNVIQVGADTNDLKLRALGDISIFNATTGVTGIAATRAWVQAQGYITGGAFVDLTTDQTIGGNKTFSGTTDFNGMVRLNGWTMVSAGGVGVGGLSWVGGYPLGQFDAATKMTELANTIGPTTLASSVVPVWKDSTQTSRALATQEYVNGLTSGPKVCASGKASLVGGGVTEGYGGLALARVSPGIGDLTWTAVPGHNYLVQLTAWVDGAVIVEVTNQQQGNAAARIKMFSYSANQFVLYDGNVFVTVYAIPQ
jgi:hypothetical protein